MTASVIKPDTITVIQPPTLHEIVNYFVCILIGIGIAAVPVIAMYHSRKSPILLTMIVTAILVFLVNYWMVIHFLIAVLLDRHPWRGQGCLLNERSGIITCKDGRKLLRGF